ncbi:RHS repeat domain-containing protein, partial [Bergeyella sp. RCAD1439]|nr:RHS repeat-associated core domain-containing protein [Bergeyella sp. RCAD1439]
MLSRGEVLLNIGLDKDGNISQHTEYIAFGEVLFDEHKVSRRMPYLFNGKELDSETGLYYYGARYYDPRVSLWLNVDPLVEKTMQPYAYTNNNPIMLIDPT